MTETREKDRQDKIAVVTGANSGIGLEIALGLARRGVRVIMLCRDTARGKAAQKWLQQEAPGARTELLLADLSSMRNVRAAAASLRAYYGHIDILVNNAGLFTPHREETADGHEAMFAVNYLAPFLLTLELLPLLRRAARGRIINVGSASADHVRLHGGDLSARFGSRLRAYGQSKLALLIFTVELARRLQGATIVVNCVHPGTVATRIGAVGGWVGVLWGVLRPFLRSARRGAQVVLKLALASELAPEWADWSGAYVKDAGQVRPNLQAGDRELALRLWTRSLQMTGAVDNTQLWPPAGSGDGTALARYRATGRVDTALTPQTACGIRTSVLRKKETDGAS
ncbi:MAG: SDR family oxidoreductase [Alphaproteobacteria bacterium]